MTAFPWCSGTGGPGKALVGNVLPSTMVWQILGAASFSVLESLVPRECPFALNLKTQFLMMKISALSLHLGFWMTL